MKDRPQWLTLAEDLFSPVLETGLRATRNLRFDNPDVEPMAYMALCHFAGCLDTSTEVNKTGKHSVAICLARQCLEALSIVDLGLQRQGYAEPLLLDWVEGKRTTGDLRKRLQQDVWPEYGRGLWNETWAEFFANLAQAVHPYAHYSPELQGWQWATVVQRQTGAVMAIGMGTYDELKATRITLLHALLVWAAARLLLVQGGEPALPYRDRVHELGGAIASCNLLVKEGDWGLQLIPHLFFKPGHDWRDSV
jgi:hypothetical protein